MKKNLIFIFYLVSGIIVGSLLAVLGDRVSWLSWLSFGVNIGFGADQPALLDLAVLKLWFGFSFSLTIAHIIAIGAALALYSARKSK